MLCEVELDLTEEFRESERPQFPGREPVTLRGGGDGL